MINLICLFLTCVTLDPELQQELNNQYASVGQDEFVGWIDNNQLSIDGVQTTGGKIISLNKNCIHSGTVIHSHPQNFPEVFPLNCFASEKDLVSKSFFPKVKDFYLICSPGIVIKY